MLRIDDVLLRCRVERIALERWIAMPRYHHWHHAIELEARDRNFAVHLPVIDRWFGTHHLPDDAWPQGYGVSGLRAPEGYLRQLVYDGAHERYGEITPELRERIEASWDMETQVRTVEEFRDLLVDQLPFHFRRPGDERAGLVPDGATLQMGIGGIPLLAAILAFVLATAAALVVGCGTALLVEPARGLFASFVQAACSPIFCHSPDCNFSVAGFGVCSV